MSSRKTEFMVMIFGDETEEVDLAEEPIPGEFYTFDGMGHVNEFIEERGGIPHQNPELAKQKFMQLRDGRAALMVRGYRLGLGFKVVS